MSGGRPREWDYSEVARVWHLAVDRGENPVEAVATWKGRSTASAEYAIAQARSLGLVPPAAQRENRPGPRLEDVARVWHEATAAGTSPNAAISVEFACLATYAATLIKRCREAGLVPASGRAPRGRSKPKRPAGLPAGVVDGVCTTCGTRFVGGFAPRERHVVDPSLPPVPAADRRPGSALDTPVGKASVRRVLMCDECEFTCEIDRPRLIFRHCLEVHQRRPTLDERRPARISPRPDVSTLTAAHLR